MNIILKQSLLAQENPKFGRLNPLIYDVQTIRVLEANKNASEAKTYELSYQIESFLDDLSIYFTFDFLILISPFLIFALILYFFDVFGHKKRKKNQNRKNINDQSSRDHSDDGSDRVYMMDDGNGEYHSPHHSDSDRHYGNDSDGHHGYHGGSDDCDSDGDGDSDSSGYCDSDGGDWGGDSGGDSGGGDGGGGD